MHPEISANVSLFRPVGVMRRRFSYWRLFVIAYFLSHCAAVSHADSCVMFHKRAPVPAVCGRIANVAGERLNGVEVTLTDETGSVLFRERSDAKGKFFFGSLPKRDYTLHVDAPGYHHVERQLRDTRTNNKHCRAKIDVKLGFRVCDTGTYIKGIDKPGDLER